MSVSTISRRWERIKSIDRHRMLDVGILFVILFSGFSDFFSLGSLGIKQAAIVLHVGVHVVAGLGILHHILKD
jgi:hypothetical protein